MALTKKAPIKKVRRSKPVTQIDDKPKGEPKSEGVVVVDKAMEPYDGDLPDSMEHYRDDLHLIPVADRPSDPAFPKLAKGCYPPETYYVFDVETRRCTHMYSIDAQGVGIAWDVDYGGRYFTRITKPLRCPRFVEYCYDSSVALSNREDWNRAHKNYLGSLSSNVGGSDAQPDHRQAPRAKRPLQGKPAAKTAVSGGRTNVAPTTAPKKSLGQRKSLKRAPVERSTLLTDKGLDTRALDDAAKSMSERLTGKLGGSEKRPLKKKTLRKRG
ncbi:hypothetical protein BH789_gp067 [Gordonia phage GMA6]|uniref:Uncharacterized protein n=1 Tax=Gordonia phage GMA6 TaxID=1647285 RepID=A0A0K0NL87_9CAUD|nr:hypothetical protein BH789_gp067 [Gordonia phage GMA6]AKL88348.1 hypothetical protein GMA6_67 [Gordonia phage GMA6]